MSTANIWSDDSDGSSSTLLHPAGQAAPGWPSMGQGPWIHFTASNTDNDDTRPAEMDVDEEPYHTATNAAAWHNYMADDSDDELGDDNFGGGVAHAGILGVANFLSQGMVDEEEEEEEGLGPFEVPPGGVHFGNHQLPPLPYPHAPATEHTMFHPPAPPFTPAIGGALAALSGPGQGTPHTGFTAHEPNLHHWQYQQHLPLPHHLPLMHPNAMSNPLGNALSPDNYNLESFVRMWAWQYVASSRSPRDARYPWPKRIEPQITKPITHVDYMDLEGDGCDVQGINWDDLGVTRSDARERRSLTYKNYLNIAGSDRWQENQDVLPCTENYFRFRRMNVRKNVNLAHFQLRNVLASTSRSQIFYPGSHSVYEYNPVTGKGKSGMRSRETPNFQATTLAAAHGVLVAGGFFGEYCFRRTTPEGSGEVHEGTITTDQSGITNHVELHLSRSSSGPKASFASNDNGFRVLDIETDKFVSKAYYEKPVNCTALSPDLRLRVVVGDQREVLITKAEPDGKPEILHALGGHGDFGFSCAWADDGWTVATGFQDKSVKIWDARRWTDAWGRAAPVCTLRSELAGCRSLKFSPLGSGKRVLVAAEEADYVSIYDAQTWQSKQTFDFFGEIGGTTFTNEGQDLQVLCCDPTRGGLFQLERCGMGYERSHDPEGASYNRNWRNGSYDWPEFHTTPRLLPRHSETHRRRRALAVDSIDPF